MAHGRNHFDLRAIARERLLRYGFLVDPPAAALAEAARLQEPDFGKLGVKDLTGLLWSSIDNDTSRDLDQIEYIRPDGNGTRLYIAIADLTSFVAPASELDKAAEHNTTSLYTGVLTFPMFPNRLSTDLTSLLEGEERLAFVVEMLIDPDGRIAESALYRARVRNQAQLTYHAAGAWLEGKENTGSPVTVRTLAKIRANAELQEQLRQQDALAQTLRERRLEAGALTLETIEVEAQLSDEEQWDLTARVLNPATRLIEDFMITANQATVSFLQKKNFPALRRVVRTPKDWPRIVKLAELHGASLPAEPDSKALEDFLTHERRRDPDRFPDLSLAVIKLLGRGEYTVASGEDGAPGHFALAVEGYAHTTAPNRRYPDVITQRLVAAALSGQKLPYSMSQLSNLAEHCTEKEHEAKKAERSVHKSVAAAALASRIGETFEGMITGAAQKGVWVRLRQPPIEGRLQGATEGLAVGDRVSVKLVLADPWRGYIDFVVIKRLPHH